MIRIGICDDMPEEVCKQSSLTRLIMERFGLNAEIYSFGSGEELLQGIRMLGGMDILLMDIEMDGENGIETAQRIRETDFRTILIFISAYDQYCKEMIEVQPFAFLDKPVTEENLEEILRKAVRVVHTENERFRFFNSKRRYSIPLHQIMCFESNGRKICVHCPEACYCFYGKLNAVEKEISGYNAKFARVQVSYLVNLNYIKEWNYDRIIMDDGMEISISKKYRKSMKEWYLRVLEER